MVLVLPLMRITTIIPAYLLVPDLTIMEQLQDDPVHPIYLLLLKG